MLEWVCRGEILYFANNNIKGAWSLINMHCYTHIINAKQYLFSDIFLLRERNGATLAPWKYTCLHGLREFICISRASWVFFISYL